MSCCKVFGCAVVMLFLGLATVAQADIITNGSFGTDGTGGSLTDWTTYSGDGQVGTSAFDADPSSPAMYAYMGNGVYQTTTHVIATGDVYDVSALATMSYVDATTSFALTLYSDDGTTKTDLVSLSFAPPTANVFATYSGSFTAETVGVGGHLGIRTSHVGAYVNLDSIAVNVTAAPEPSTIVLVGTGLIGLLAYAWRKRR